MSNPGLLHTLTASSTRSDTCSSTSAPTLPAPSPAPPLRLASSGAYSFNASHSPDRAVRPSVTPTLLRVLDEDPCSHGWPSFRGCRAYLGQPVEQNAMPVRQVRTRRMSRLRWVGSHLGSVTIGCIYSGIRVDRADPAELAGAVCEAGHGGQRDGQGDPPGEPGGYRAAGRPRRRWRRVRAFRLWSAAVRAAVAAGAGVLMGNHHLRRYGWSWSEPPAGATPHHPPEPLSPGQDRGLRAAGVTNG